MLVQILTDTEGTTGPRQHDTADPLISGQLLQRGQQLGLGGEIESVQSLGTVQANQTDAAEAFDHHWGARGAAIGHGAHSSGL